MAANSRLRILKSLSPLCPMPNRTAMCPEDIAAGLKQLIQKDAGVGKLSQDPRNLAILGETSRIATARSVWDDSVGYSKTLKQLREATAGLAGNLGNLPPAIYDAGPHLLVAKHSARDISDTEVLAHMMATDAAVRERVIEVRTELAQNKQRADLRVIPQLFIFAREAIR